MGWPGLDWNRLQQVVDQVRRKSNTASPAMETTRFCTTGRFRTCVTSIGRPVRVSISIPVQLGHGPQSACKDSLLTSSTLHQRFIFAMEDASREDSKVRTICTSLNASYCNLKSKSTSIFGQ